jgi:hypothetical protein
MKRRTVKKYSNAGRMVKRERDKFDRAYVLYFMRHCIEVLAREGDVNEKIHDVAAIARRLAPAIEARRAAEKRSTDR